MPVSVTIAGLAAGSLDLDVPAHGVRVVKLLDRAIPETAPVIDVAETANGTAGEPARLTAAQTGGDPVVAWTWNFGDGVTADGATASHTWTEPGDYAAVVTARGLDGETAQKKIRVHVGGAMTTTFNPGKIRRLQ